MTHIQIVALYTVPCALILFALSVNCIRLRFKHKTSLGHGGHEEMERAMRAHANAAEHIPIVLIMLVLLGMLQASTLFIHIAGAVLVAGRTLHALAFTQVLPGNHWRVSGQVLTFAAYFVAIAGLVVSVLR